jgi:hypothetical protein
MNVIVAASQLVKANLPVPTCAVVGAGAAVENASGGFIERQWNRTTTRHVRRLSRVPPLASDPQRLPIDRVRMIRAPVKRVPMECHSMGGIPR